MNFFGHAVVASWQSRDPHLGLGAMLPDLVTMIGGRLAAVNDPRLASGIDLHHQTDAAFHQLDVFCALCREATARLRDGGLRRGPARGAAHVAVEISLDSWLASDAAGQALYLASLEASDAARLRWQSPDDAHRFFGLMDRLVDAGPPASQIDPDRAAYRITRALSARPLLALETGEAEHLHATMLDIDAAVRESAPALIAGLRTALARANSA